MKLKTYLEKQGLSQKDFGARLGVSQGLVWQWLEWLDDPEEGTRVTAEKAIEIEEATNGAVTRHELRPDIFATRAA